ncbi:sphingomyelin phosphodiesterase A-like [Photinus pyralis]|uniref:sphingomyelin phosphodiesterase A-like n=1 Tax=Photinus pyralis TaxID=7054 RepID=UPI00126769C2|nr:sphingomyelin phosphodiesterase A-like [Photinus pyralis]
MKVIVLATLLCSVTGSLEIIFKRVESSISCGVCELLVNIFYTAAKKNEPMSFVKLKFVPLCRVAQNSIVCNGIFDTFAPDILEAFQYVQISPTEICSMLMEACPQMRIPEHEWTVNLTSVPKPRVQEKPRSKANNVIKILQINDIHLDTDYAVGSTSNCQEPLCCRNLSTNKLLARNIPAERWGSAECDTPLKTLDYILEVIAERHTDISYIMWLGDIAPHDIWRQTKAGQLITLRDGISALKRFFPNTLVLPTIGNHETKPDGR